MNDADNSNSEEVQPSIEVPAGVLSDDALKGVIEEFILRYGTDYGVQEVSHETKIEQVRRQIAKGDIKIVFDPNIESVTLMTARDWAKSKPQ